MAAGYEQVLAEEGSRTRRRADWLGVRRRLTLRLPVEGAAFAELDHLCRRERVSVPQAAVAALDEWAWLQRRKRARGSHD